MFKNSLFLKVIMVFTLPALGILYFSTLLVSEKIDSMKEIYKIYDNLNYLENTEKLIHNLQKERGLSVTFNESKDFKSQLMDQRAISDENFNNYIKFVNDFLKNDFSNLALETKIKEIQDKFFDLNNKRNEIDKYGYSSLEILDIYSKA
jgi:hypothetical protein